MRILMVSPYPPNRDGIAAYAVQDVRALRSRGDDVEVLSPGPSAAHHHLALTSSRGPLALAKRVRGYDRIIIQFHPDFFYPVPCSPSRRAAISLQLAATFRWAKHVEVVVHEIDYRHGRAHTVDGVAARLMWQAVDTIVVHTESERSAFSTAFGVGTEHIKVAGHGSSFIKYTRHDRDSARVALGLDQSLFYFLAIGFIQPHKGFDRAARAFAGIDPARARLEIVGSLRLEEPGYVAYAQELADLAERTPGVTLHTGFVSDELFDRWIVACDTVVLPYRSIWSSGVMERAALYDRPVVATRVGGLAEQKADHDVTLVEDDEELKRVMRELTGQPHRAAAGSWPITGADVRSAVQNEVRARAARARGTATAVGVGAPGPLLQRSLDASRSLRRLPPFVLPAPEQNPVGVARLVKKSIRRLTYWQMAPVAQQLNSLQQSTMEAVESLGAVGTAMPTRDDKPVDNTTDPASRG
ncbi:MAG: glycosyltransferase family 4 protein [Actinobacteria bacterium]|nr:glycosyltransferase family 4 protein [Actinomycetota bacterium]